MDSQEGPEQNSPSVRRSSAQDTESQSTVNDDQVYQISPPPSPSQDLITPPSESPKVQLEDEQAPELPPRESSIAQLSPKIESNNDNQAPSPSNSRKSDSSLSEKPSTPKLETNNDDQVRTPLNSPKSDSSLSENPSTPKLETKNNNQVPSPSNSPKKDSDSVETLNLPILQRNDENSEKSGEYIEILPPISPKLEEESSPFESVPSQCNSSQFLGDNSSSYPKDLIVKKKSKVLTKRRDSKVHSDSSSVSEAHQRHVFWSEHTCQTDGIVERLERLELPGLVAVQQHSGVPEGGRAGYQEKHTVLCSAITANFQGPVGAVLVPLDK